MESTIYYLTTISYILQTNSMTWILLGDAGVCAELFIVAYSNASMRLYNPSLSFLKYKACLEIYYSFQLSSFIVNSEFT